MHTRTGWVKEEKTNICMIIYNLDLITCKRIFFKPPKRSNSKSNTTMAFAVFYVAIPRPSTVI